MTTEVDIQTLSKLIQTCFNLSMDLTLAEQDRNGFLVLGKRLRGTLINLISARFNDGTQALTQANNRLSTVNDRIEKIAAHLAQVADTLEDIGNLVGELDKLLSFAVAFV